ncbi:MAG: signal transduction histidine kinase [Polaribacter sp.]|jgi:signal transduction histidine kinase
MKNNRLYWRISATLMALMIIVGLGYMVITRTISRQYYDEVSQVLHAKIADYAVKHTTPAIKNGVVDTAVVQEIMHSMMVINPSVEVYLLDKVGNIMMYVAPDKTIKLEKVDLLPIKKFIESDGPICVTGDDPRHPGERKVFSAAPIIENEQLTGYMYIILMGEYRAAVTSMLDGNYLFKMGANMFFLTLVGALLIGLLAIWLLTRNLRELMDTVRRFKEGDYKARVAVSGTGELADLSHDFNDMADTIVANIDELKSVENLRRELIANISHDLRTPLAIMKGYVETLLLKDDNINADQRKQYLETTLSSGDRLSKLIAQLFEYSKLEAKQIQLKKEPFFITEIAQDIYQKYQLLAKERGITMHLNASPEIPMVFADIGLVERVIQNLMDNALKFTPEGGKVNITLNAVGKKVEVRIADTGPGIPEGEQSAIFERYGQAEQSDDIKKSGAGLGLAIAKKILELHHATINVQSRLNEGTAFSFQLPAYVEVA